MSSKPGIGTNAIPPVITCLDCRAGPGHE
jgi:hypothetical protein